MISILIPIYNYDCTSLLNELANQIPMLHESIEVITIEDGSISYVEKNKIACEKLGFHHLISEHNQGRARIRNFLASQANFEWLLFLDCDSRIINENFLQNYLNIIPVASYPIYVGGRVVDAKRNIQKQYVLHWNYGRYREDLSTKDPSSIFFMSNNFIIKKSIFDEILFDETITEYGHEDTLFGFCLKRKGYQIGFINNPILHEGLDSNQEFLLKTKRAVSNLKKIADKKLNSEESNQIKLLRYFKTIQKYHLSRMGSVFYRMMNKTMEAQLTSKKPSLYVLDLYKLSFLCYTDVIDRQRRYKIDRQ